ncbi:MAG TPA: hypothetical protein VLA93_05290 [Pyrinomonadaceae bacterium]|nr:hypothetical protein [Pyrinomonadaceae bacterium]
MPFLTLHRPNFCAECGAKILRLRWRLWTNRKFCDSCARSLRRQRWTTAGVITLLIFTTGLILGHRLQPSPPPLIIQRTERQSGDSTSGSSPQPLTVEEVYICGARTKKGRPCSRRVHGPVRCWQHKGEKAMLPQEKLRIQ